MEKKLRTCAPGQDEGALFSKVFHFHFRIFLPPLLCGLEGKIWDVPKYGLAFRRAANKKTPPLLGRAWSNAAGENGIPAEILIGKWAKQ